MRATDGSPAVRLGDGIALEFSPDGRWALVQNRAEHDLLTLLPTGAGRERTLPLPPLTVHQGTWMPDGQRSVPGRVEPGRGMRLYIYDLGSEQLGRSARRPRGQSRKGVSRRRFALARNASGSYALYPTEGGPPQPLEGSFPESGLQLGRRRDRRIRVRARARSRANLPRGDRDGNPRALARGYPRTPSGYRESTRSSSPRTALPRHQLHATSAELYIARGIL